MEFLLVILTVLILLFALYALSVMGRRRHSGLDALQGFRYAHRGLHGPGVPENSMAAFRAALDKGYGIELDVHRMADGQLAVIHDHSLLRTAGVDIDIETLTQSQLADYRLEGTEQTIPTFSQVLELYAGKAPLIVELKAKGNHAALTDAAVALLRDYPGAYCIESFDPRCVLHLKKHHRQVIRGQLARNFSVSPKEKLPWPVRFIMTHQLLNFLLQPDFVAYRFSDRKNLGNFLVRKLWGVQGVSWTIRSQKELDQAEKEGYLAIFESFQP